MISNLTVLILSGKNLMILVILSVTQFQIIQHRVISMFKLIFKLLQGILSEKEMATHPSSLLPWTEEPGGQQSTGPQSCTGLSDWTCTQGHCGKTLIKDGQSGGFPGHPVPRAPSFHCRGQGSNSESGKIPHLLNAAKKKGMVSQLVFERLLSNGFNYGYLNLHLRIC